MPECHPLWTLASADALVNDGGIQACDMLRSTADTISHS